MREALNHKLKMLWQEDKASTGYSQFPPRLSSMNPVSPTAQYSSGVNKSLAKEGSCTGKSWSPSPRRNLWPGSEPSSGIAMPNSQDQTQPGNTSGKKTPVSQVPSSSSESYPLEETLSPIGMPSEFVQLQGIYKQYLPTFTFGVITNSAELAKTIYRRLEWSGPVQFSGAKLALASRVGPGKKPVWTLTLKTQTPNSGTVTEIIEMLLLMNLEVLSQYPTSSGGLTVIRSLWKSKDPRLCCELSDSGSLPT